MVALAILAKMGICVGVTATAEFAFLPTQGQDEAVHRIAQLQFVQEEALEQQVHDRSGRVLGHIPDVAMTCALGLAADGRESPHAVSHGGAWQQNRGGPLGD